MKRIISFMLMALLFQSVAFSQKDQNAGITYFLPQTALLVEVEVIKTEEVAGPYYRYGERYLALKNVIAEDKTSYEISNLQLKFKTVANPNMKFEVDPSNISLYLNNQGLLAGINTKPQEVKKDVTKKIISPRANKKDDTFRENYMITEEQLLANSTAKMAELAAKQIYRIRESRLSLITGDMEEIPADGESMKLMLNKMDEAEKSLMQLFTGKKTVTKSIERVEIVPEKSMQSEIIARFSSHTGLVDKSDLSGEPIYMSISTNETPIPQADTSVADGFFYIIPALAKVEVTSTEKTLASKQISFAQLGSVQKLPFKLFKGGKQKAEFNLKTGVLKNLSK